jgi:hypothetical protein
MFTNLIRKASTVGENKLNGAIVLSIAAMLSFNVLVLAQQVDRSASFAQSEEAAPVQQA